MNTVRRWFRVVAGKDEPAPTVEAREALAGSKERMEAAEKQADDMARVVAPLREAVARNHFEDAVRALFIGRPA